MNDVKLVSNAAVEQTVFHDSNKYLDYLKSRISDIANGYSEAWIKDKIIYDDPYNEFGDVRPMTCFTNLVKMVKVIATNPKREKNPNVSVGTVMQLDMEENYPVALYDATALSSIRTAAMALLALEYMAEGTGGFDKVLIVGFGQIGKYIRRMGVGRYNNAQFKFLDKNDEVPKRYSADAIIMATDSKEPILTEDNCDAKYIISVGADTHFNRELDTELIHSKRHCVDVVDAYHIGDLERTWIEPVISNDLLYMVKNDIKPEIFISVGSPLMDALTVEYLSDNGT